MNSPLPMNQFGMTRTRYNIDCLPETLPQRETLEAANAFNNMRFKGLTYQQRIFVEAYLSNNFDAGYAALEAKYTVDADEAKRVGNRLLKKPYIKHALELAFEYYREKGKLRREDVINEYRKVAFANADDYWQNDGLGDPYIKMPASGDRDRMAAVSEITVRSYKEGKGPAAREVKEVKFKLYDKIQALDRLMKHLDREEGIVESFTGQTINNDNRQVYAPVTFNIVPVPTGSFIPAPESPYAVATAIDHIAITELVDVVK